MSLIVRKALLTAPIEGSKVVERVEIKEIELSAIQNAGLHLYPCPVVGHVVEGEIAFQIETTGEEDLRRHNAWRVFRSRNIR